MRIPLAHRMGDKQMILRKGNLQPNVALFARFAPQDGNSLLSSIAQTLRWLDRDSLDDRIDCLRPYLFQEI